MKNLYHHVLEVSNDLERKMAIEFYRRAAKKPLHPCHLTGRYVGLTEHGFVCSNFIKYPYETVVSFRDIATLADSPARVKALENMRNMYPTVIKPNFSHVTSSPKPESKKVPSKMLPVVTFWYPSSVTRQNIERKVRVVKADTIHIIGFDINKNEQFKKFKRAKVSGLVSLVAFNS